MEAGPNDKFTFALWEASYGAKNSLVSLANVLQNNLKKTMLLN